MYRRLNYLLPDIAHAQQVVNHLNKLGIDFNDIHAFSKEPISEGVLPTASENQKMDRASAVENLFWTGNLIFFFLCFAVLFAAIVEGQLITGIISLTLMIISFAIGNFFASYIPHVHLSEFKHALSHNELLLTVDVADDKLDMVENEIHRHHPEAIEAGSSWTLKGVDI